MRPQRSTSGRILASWARWIGLATLLLSVPASAEEWYETYHRAEAALERQDWTQALVELHSAIDQQPTSNARARTYGMRFVEYFPFLDLGVAYFHLGQFDEALQAFEKESAQGQIDRSQKHLEKLRSFRDRIEKERARNERALRKQRDLILETSLSEARRLQLDSLPSEALAALDRGLAVDPNHEEALSLRQLLLSDLARQRKRARVEEQIRDLNEQAGRALDQQQLSLAAALLSEALALDENPETRELLTDVQSRLKEEVEGTNSSHDSGVPEFAGVLLQMAKDVERSLTEAQALKDAGDLDESMFKLQRILAVAPENQRALDLNLEITRLRALAANQASDSLEVERLLSEAELLATSGRYEDVLRMANRVLAINATEGRALRLVSQSYARMNTALLEDGRAAPLVVLDEEHLTKGAPQRRTQSPKLELSGSVFDSGPVEVVALLNGAPLTVSLVSRALPDVWVSTFEVPASLPAGKSSLEIRATDTSGQVSAVLYEIDYSVPFVRSVWLPLAAGSLVLALLGGIVALRRHRRKTLLHRRFNPYVAGAPVLDQKRFFGRQHLLEYVLRRIPNNSIMLYGERRIGKTSFQHRLKRCLETMDDPDHAFYPVFVDLQGTPQESFFATLAAEIFHELAPRLDGLEPQPELASGQYSHRELVKDLHAVLKTLKEQTEKKVKLVLLIDEVDELNDYDPRVNQRLRSLFMRAFAENLVAVVSGVAIKKQWEREGSPWYNFFQEIEVEPLDAVDARSLIESPVRGVFAFDQGVAEEIIRRARRKPYLIQRLCSWIVDRMHDERRSEIRLSDVEAACRAEKL